MDVISAWLASSPREILAHLRMRWFVFKKQKGYLPGLKTEESLEVDEFDRLTTTRHFIAVAKRDGPPEAVPRR